MFRTIVKSVLNIPGFDYLHIVGKDSVGSVSVGDHVTDGDVCYKITSTPLMCRANGIKPFDEVDICIKIDGCDVDALIGKTLYSINESVI